MSSPIKVTQPMVDAAQAFIRKPVAPHLHSATGDPWVKALIEAALAAAPVDDYAAECRRAMRLANAGLSEGDIVQAMGVDRVSVREMIEAGREI